MQGGFFCLFSYCAHTVQPIFAKLGLGQVYSTASHSVTVSMHHLEVKVTHCKGHITFWLLYPHHRTNFHETRKSTCVEYGDLFCELEI